MKPDLGMPFEHEPLDAGTFWLCGLSVRGIVAVLSYAAVVLIQMYQES